jgi:hypothetical protein
MQLTKSVLASLVLLGAAVSASAVTVQDFGSHTLSYDETTGFGFLSSSFTAGGGQAGFTWTVPNSAQVASFGSLEMVTIALPSFTISANAGWALSGASGFLGNLVFTEVGGATTQIILNADVSVNGGAPVSLSDNVSWTSTSGGAGYLNGYFGETWGPTGAFNTLTVSNASIVLSATGGVFSSISAQPQNKLEISLVAMPVPEPETGAMLLAGLGALAWLGARRQRG